MIQKQKKTKKHKRKKKQEKESGRLTNAVGKPAYEICCHLVFQWAIPVHRSVWWRQEDTTVEPTPTTNSPTISIVGSHPIFGLVANQTSHPSKLPLPALGPQLATPTNNVT